jgi:hypothetical protein
MGRVKRAAKKGNLSLIVLPVSATRGEEDVANMLEDSSDDEDEGDEQDEYVDKDAKAVVRSGNGQCTLRTTNHDAVGGCSERI